MALIYNGSSDFDDDAGGHLAVVEITVGRINPPKNARLIEWGCTSQIIVELV